MRNSSVKPLSRHQKINHQKAVVKERVKNAIECINPGLYQLFLNNNLSVKGYEVFNAFESEDSERENVLSVELDDNSTAAKEICEISGNRVTLTYTVTMSTRTAFGFGKKYHETLTFKPKLSSKTSASAYMKSLERAINIFEQLGFNTGDIYSHSGFRFTAFRN